MASVSLNRISVPLAGQVSQGLLMPKMKYRFRATFENFGVSSEKQELTKQVVDIKRPNVNFNPFAMDVYNSKVYILGKPEWQETTINLRDDAGGNVSKLVGEQIQKQFDFAEQSSAASGIDYKFVLRYEVLDGGNGTQDVGVLETWELSGCLLSSVDYGDLNYATSEAATIALTVRFDNALQVPTGAGVGSIVGRTIGTLTTG